MKIVCPICAFVIDAGDVPETLLSVIGDGTLSVHCPGCASEIELAPLTATLQFAGSSSTWRGMLVRTEGHSSPPAAAR
jgi:hypothetical protein